ncbi:MAG: hypothetical protein JXA09_08300 [Anaerolineae bacterium]|nr:hypothetical protein [Anaerolineae bacterium]
MPSGEIVQADVPRIATSPVPDAQLAQFAAGNNAFAFGLYRATAAETDGNLVFSPYSISLLFSMVYAGNRGEAERQMAQVLHFLPQEAQHPAFNVVDQRLRDLGEPPERVQSALPTQPEQRGMGTRGRSNILLVSCM